MDSSSALFGGYSAHALIFDRTLVQEDSYPEISLQTWRAFGLVFSGRGQEAEGLVEIVRRAADRINSTELSVRTCHVAGLLYFYLGDWDAFDKVSGDYSRLGTKFSNLLAVRALSRFEQGDFDGGNSLVSILFSNMESAPLAANMEYTATGLVLPQIARISGNKQHLIVAEEAASVVLSSEDITPMYVASARTGLALIAAERNDARLAAEQYKYLRRFARAMNAAVALDRVLGLASRAMGMDSVSAAHFEDSIKFCRAANYKPEEAWSCADYSELLLDRNASGDREKAIELQDEAISIATELGMKPLLERVLAKREILKA